MRSFVRKLCRNSSSCHLRLKCTHCDDPMSVNYISCSFLGRFVYGRKCGKKETEALKLLGLKVPGLVQNGTEESVVLDCLYDLGSAENSAEGGKRLGLVVKWFFEGDPYPVYQWIPKHPPQGQGKLRGRVDLDYRATNDESTMHRALFIKKPTVELSGQYTCTVSTFDDEKSLSKTMVVYVPEKTMEMWQSKPRDDVVRVTCKAKGVYPEPNVTLFLQRVKPGAVINHLKEKVDTAQMDEDSDEMEEEEVDITTLIPLEGVNVQTTRREEGLWDVEAYAEVSERNLIEGMDSDNPTPVFFHCLLGIPHSEYSRRVSIIYFPGPSTTPSSVTMETTLDEDNGKDRIIYLFIYFLLPHSF
ncbi:hypothetical protein J437_LFUL009427 [Ladona fulva]|uniref:Ig-like domain-containing protein n=1 Tax=Ladona fulva TaxID=123851 RepID=A0A8K0K822_LADFU|nr:hypothetical protein J437_LFUL009427 [Ladona fulva]